MTFRTNRGLFESIITFSNIKLSSLILSLNNNLILTQPKIIPTKYLKGFTCNDSYAFDLAMVNYLYRMTKKINNLSFLIQYQLLLKIENMGKVAGLNPCWDSLR